MIKIVGHEIPKTPKFESFHTKNTFPIYYKSENINSLQPCKYK